MFIYETRPTIIYLFQAGPLFRTLVPSWSVLAEKVSQTGPAEWFVDKLVDHRLW